jgi:zinc protease
LYGPQHPYGYLESGNEQATKAITRDDLEKFWKAGYVPGNSALVVAGDITQPQVKQLAEKYFGKWTGSFTRPSAPPVKQNAARGILIVDKPGAPQTAMRFATVAVPRSTPDYVPLEVMNTALGGLFSSRLNMNLREEHGYTYGAFSVVLYRRAPGPFIAVAGVRTDVTAPAVRETFTEIDRMRSTDLTPEELTMAKNAFSLSLAGKFETTAQTAETVGELFIYDLPLTYYQSLPSKIDAVSAPEVKRVATQYLRPESMVVVAVGDKAKIEPELKKLDLAPISYRDYEGKVIKAAAAEAK